MLNTEIENVEQIDNKFIATNNNKIRRCCCYCHGLEIFDATKEEYGYGIRQRYYKQRFGITFQTKQKIVRADGKPVKR